MKTLSLRLNIVTRQVIFNKTKIGGKLNKLSRFFLLFRDVSGGALDTVEKLFLEPGNLNNFMIYDGMGGYYDEGNFWHKRHSV